MARRIWAFQPLDELNGQVGWVECEDELARTLIEQGRVQDPSVGALALKPVMSERAHAYRTTQLVPPSTTDAPKGRRRARS